ncbi:MAG: hypothetical protein COX02_00410 [Candidatus Vogelbacteria bacterium CG22_combo_CG10-13_8_21_14_all_37_9]|uniref:Uncharacterized protein n=1 Tax=Candidatus Vogelbacteria bacterium CG22_combo_CG10-13_8_21_14_all_37_9 TaxID=1975046 RepID=A0A2H0BL65_9BACT|nr:MAG: hypothetical protein BK005_01360 [bacterium CG10_37_50]PIP58423.1 MAG: hypothetical protein COX02_00410 [Candidatus Vogelbacteria bacterium CG22_combo_CG10-13_8_21_14_all_37_9]
MAKLGSDNLNLIKKLYYQDCHSVRQIALVLGVSLDVVYHFMRQHQLKRRTTIESNKLIYDRKPATYVLKSHLSKSEEKLKNIGITLYWGEGFKASTANLVDLANSDVQMVKVFLRFLREICGIKEDRLRIYLYCYANQKPLDLIKFWSKICQVSLRQFSQPYIRQDYQEGKKSKMPHGMIHIRYGDKKLLKQILTWIEDYKKEFA